MSLFLLLLLPTTTAATSVRVADDKSIVVEGYAPSDAYHACEKEEGRDKDGDAARYAEHDGRG